LAVFGLALGHINNKRLALVQKPGPSIHIDAFYWALSTFLRTAIVGMPFEEPNDANRVSSPLKPDA
jgi:hypothetical protein